MLNFKWFVRETKARLNTPNGRRYMKWRLIEGVGIAVFMWMFLPKVWIISYALDQPGITPYVLALSAIPMCFFYLILDVWFSERKIPNKEEEQ